MLHVVFWHVFVAGLFDSTMYKPILKIYQNLTYLFNISIDFLCFACYNIVFEIKGMF